MGSTAWSAKHFDDRVVLRAATAKAKGITTDAAAFAYDHDIKTGKTAAATHKDLDPKGVVFRESRDSTAHPEAVPIAVLLDVTGSQADAPKIAQANLPKLMGLLIRKGYVEHPAIFVLAERAGPGLPPQRTYTFAEQPVDDRTGVLACVCVGHVVLPTGATAHPRGGYRLFEFHTAGKESPTFIGMTGLRAVRAAMAGDWGMKWEGEQR
jgi:hypothetical protein